MENAAVTVIPLRTRKRTHKRSLNLDREQYKAGSFDRHKNIGDHNVVSDSAPRRVRLLRTRFRQSVHRFDRSQHVDVCNPGSRVIVSWFDVRPSEDRRDSVLKVESKFVLRHHKRISQAAILLIDINLYKTCSDATECERENKK